MNTTKLCPVHSAMRLPLADSVEASGCYGSFSCDCARTRNALALCSHRHALAAPSIDQFAAERSSCQSHPPAFSAPFFPFPVLCPPPSLLSPLHPLDPPCSFSPLLLVPPLSSSSPLSFPSPHPCRTRRPGSPPGTSPPARPAARAAAPSTTAPAARPPPPPPVPQALPARRPPPVRRPAGSAARSPPTPAGRAACVHRAAAASPAAAAALPDPRCPCRRRRHRRRRRRGLAGRDADCRGGGERERRESKEEGYRQRVSE